MRKTLAIIALVIVLLVVGVIAAFQNGLVFVDDHQETAVTTTATPAPANPTTAAPSVTATSVPDTAEEYIECHVVNGQQLFVGREELVIMHMRSISQQNWLDYAVIDAAHYGRVKDNQEVVYIDGYTFNATCVDEMPELNVYRIGNAFCIEDKFGNVNVDNQRTERVATMNDLQIIQRYNVEHEALISSAATNECYPNAANIVGTLSVESGFDSELLKALVLVRFTETINGEPMTVYAVEWKIWSPDDQGNDNVNPPVEPPVEPTATATVAPTATATVTPTATATVAPTATATVAPTATATVAPTATATVAPTATATVAPTATATVAPTATATVAPTATATVAPTHSPVTVAPTKVPPTTAPTHSPATVAPTKVPPIGPEHEDAPVAPTRIPVNTTPTIAPTKVPTIGDPDHEDAPVAPTKVPVNTAPTKAPDLGGVTF